LHLFARKRAGNEALVKGMLVVVAFRADGLKPRDETVFAVGPQRASS
jgi:hypothetical protein